MAEVLRVIQPIPHKELMGGIEPDEFRFVLETVGDALVQQSANFERTRLAFLEQRHQSVERAA